MTVVADKRSGVPCLCPYGCHVQCQQENRVKVYAVFSGSLVLEKWPILISVMFLLFISIDIL